MLFDKPNLLQRLGINPLQMFNQVGDLQAVFSKVSQYWKALTLIAAW